LNRVWRKRSRRIFGTGSVADLMLENLTESRLRITEKARLVLPTRRGFG
jgi:hypothetical protein